ncbi:ABC transporter permease [Reinekea sp.]|jgi:ribose transport system permease protein|uniref:ABC transporter permease n=1 Tax=Reinekea sp. TaxID=1970455 RepID=UPI003989688E
MNTKVTNVKKSPMKEILLKLPRFDFATYAPLIALLILIAFSAFASEHFLVPRNITNVLRQVSYTGIIALGMTFVIIAGGIDLSVGSMVALVGTLTILLVNWLGDGWWPVVLAMSAAVVIGGGLGAINGVVITRGRVAAFIATLATMSIFRSITLYISDAGEVVSTNSNYADIGGGYFLGIPFPVWTFLILAVGFHILLKHTAYGRHVCAVGSNSKVASYSAINVRRVYFVTFVIAGATVGIASVLLTSRLNSVSPSDAGLFYELDAIAAVVIGGTALSGGRGTIWGTVIGAIILGIINNMLNLLGVSPYLQGTVKGLVILIAVLAQFKGDR